MTPKTLSPLFPTPMLSSLSLVAYLLLSFPLLADEASAKRETTPEKGESTLPTEGDVYNDSAEKIIVGFCDSRLLHDMNVGHKKFHGDNPRYASKSVAHRFLIHTGRRNQIRDNNLDPLVAQLNKSLEKLVEDNRKRTGRDKSPLKVDKNFVLRFLKDFLSKKKTSLEKTLNEDDLLNRDRLAIVKDLILILDSDELKIVKKRGVFDFILSKKDAKGKESFSLRISLFPLKGNETEHELVLSTRKSRIWFRLCPQGTDYRQIPQNFATVLEVVDPFNRKPREEAEQTYRELQESRQRILAGIGQRILSDSNLVDAINLFEKMTDELSSTTEKTELSFTREEHKETLESLALAVREIEIDFLESESGSEMFSDYLGKINNVSRLRNLEDHEKTRFFSDYISRFGKFPPTKDGNFVLEDPFNPLNLKSRRSAD